MWACTKNKERIQKFELLGDSQYKTCFQHDMAYGDFQDQLLRRTTSDKLLGIKAFNIAKNPKYDGYHSGLALMGKDFLTKELLAVVLKMRICQISN